MLSLLHAQAVNAAEAAGSTGAAEAALGQVTAMLQPSQEPGSLLLRRLQAQLLLPAQQVRGCATAPCPSVVLPALVLWPSTRNRQAFCAP